MTKLQKKGLTGAALVAVLMAGSLGGLEARADNAVVWEARTAAASVIEGQGWLTAGPCLGCVVGAVLTAVLSAGTGGAAALVGCGILCYITLK